MAGFCVLDLLSKAYYTMEKTLAPLLVNGGILLCNWGLNRLLGPRWGGAGLAGATAISITLGGAVMACLLLGRVKGLRLDPLVKSAIAALLTGGALYAVTGLVLTGLESKALLVVKCVGLGAAAMAVYALALACLRQEARLLFLKRKKRPKE